MSIPYWVNSITFWLEIYNDLENIPQKRSKSPRWFANCRDFSRPRRDFSRTRRDFPHAENYPRVCFEKCKIQILFFKYEKISCKWCVKWIWPAITIFDFPRGDIFNICIKTSLSSLLQSVSQIWVCFKYIRRFWFFPWGFFLVGIFPMGFFPVFFFPLRNLSNDKVGFDTDWSYRLISEHLRLG